MRSYPVKENPIGSAVSEILWYKHTDKQTSCYFSILKYKFVLVENKKLNSLLSLSHVDIGNFGSAFIEVQVKQWIFYYLDVTPDFHIL